MNGRPVCVDVKVPSSAGPFRYSAAFIYSGQGHPRQTALRSVPDECYVCVCIGYIIPTTQNSLSVAEKKTILFHAL